MIIIIIIIIVVVSLCPLVLQTPEQLQLSHVIGVFAIVGVGLFCYYDVKALRYDGGRHFMRVLAITAVTANRCVRPMTNVTSSKQYILCEGYLRARLLLSLGLLVLR